MATGRVPLQGVIAAMADVLKARVMVHNTDISASICTAWLTHARTYVVEVEGDGDGDQTQERGRQAEPQGEEPKGQERNAPEPTVLQCA